MTNTGSMCVGLEQLSPAPKVFKRLSLLSKSTLPKPNEIKTAMEQILRLGVDSISTNTLESMIMLIYSLTLQFHRHMKQMLPPEIEAALNVYDPQKLHGLWMRCIEKEDLSLLMLIRTSRLFSARPVSYCCTDHHAPFPALHS